MKVMSAKEIEEEFGLTDEELTSLEEDATNGILHGEPRGEVIIGRPLKFGEKMQQVGFKEPLQKVEQIDLRASQLKMSRSDYLRSLVETDLKLAGIA